MDHSSAKMGNGDLSSSATSKFRSNDITSKVWTNERHVDYLNSMEASFVRSMLSSLPMNRDVPDISDSTLDHRSTPTPRARRFSTSDILESTRVKSDKRTRRLPYRPYKTPSHDQVVPQYEGRRGANEEKDHQLDAAPAT